MLCSSVSHYTTLCNLLSSRIILISIKSQDDSCVKWFKYTGVSETNTVSNIRKTDLVSEKSVYLNTLNFVPMTTSRHMSVSFAENNVITYIC